MNWACRFLMYSAVILRERELRDIGFWMPWVCRLSLLSLGVSWRGVPGMLSRKYPGVGLFFFLSRR